MALVTKNFSDIITFTRASTATFFNSSGVLTSATINAPRFDYNPSTLAARGLLIEEARTNLLLQSEDFTTTWSPTLTSVTADAITSPDGTVDADKVVIDSGQTIANTYISQDITKTAVATTYTISIFAKIGEYNRINLVCHEGPSTIANRAQAQWSLSDGSVTSAAAAAGTFTNASAAAGTSVGNGWYRFALTFTSGTETSLRNRVSIRDSVAITGDGTSGAYVWGAQLEAGAFPTSYIPTTTTALTRSADEASVNTLSPWYNASASTLYAEILGFPELSASGVGRRAANFSDGTVNNRVGIGYGLATNQNFIFAASGGVQQASVSVTGTNSAKIAAAWATDDAVICANSGTVGSDTPPFVVPTVTQMEIGFGAAATTNQYANGWIRRITYYPRRLSNAELQSITTP